MHYCCPNCRHWTQLDDELAPTERCCNFCFTSIRVASGLITQIAAQNSSLEKPKLRGADAWPPVAQKYLQLLHHEASKEPCPTRHGLARWAGPISCGAILLLFGFVAQVYLGHRSAQAESSAAAESSPADASVIVPPLILESTPNSVAVRAPMPAMTTPTSASLNDSEESK